jgi:putative zinc finger/helix-turn-helix YgiT family protein
MTKIRTKKPRRGRPLPEDACPTCGATMRRQTSGAFLLINGERISVPAFAHLRCPKCGEAVLSLAEGRELQRRAIERYRAKYGLLSANEIRGIRSRLGLTQAELARLLRLGGNTISRWEAGRNVQTAAMDVLLRMIRDLPGSLKYLRDHAA